MGEHGCSTPLRGRSAVTAVSLSVDVPWFGRPLAGRLGMLDALQALARRSCAEGQVGVFDATAEKLAVANEFSVIWKAP